MACDCVTCFYLLLMMNASRVCVVFVSQMKTFRDLYAKVIGDKHEDVMAKFGAILAQGIIDAGKVVI